MKTTITDIAKDTGLSLATISKYLNNRPIRPENKKKIEDSIAKLHYVPNRTAQSLRSKNAQTVALILPPLENCLWGKIVIPIETHLKSLGYSLVIFTKSLFEESENSMLNFLLHNQLSGIIAIDQTLNSGQIQILSANQIPIVCIENYAEVSIVDTVCSDNYLKGYDAAMYLLNKNHRNLALIAGNRNSSVIRERSNGFLDALNSNSIFPVHSNCIYGVDSLSAAQRALKKLLSQDTPPSGIVFLDYLSSLGSIGEIVNSQIKVPEQLSVICFDHDTVFNALIPNITSFEADYTTLGQKAAELLIKRIRKSEAPVPVHLTVPLKFKNGHSVSDRTNL